MISELDKYLIKRRKKKITHIELSKHLNCSQSLISRFETGDCTMSKEKIEKYKQYIETK